jgi:hypothetical protein
MLSFPDDYHRRFSSTAAKPHLLIPVDPGVERLSTILNSTLATWFAQEHPGHSQPWHEVIQPVAPPHLHMTVGHLEMPSESLDPLLAKEFCRLLEERLTQIEPFTINVGPIQVVTMALNLYVEPSAQLSELVTVSRATFREVFGELATFSRPGKPWRPHIATAYCLQNISTEFLAGDLSRTVDPETKNLLGIQVMPINRLVFADQQTLHPESLWRNLDTERSIFLGGQEKSET